MVESVQITLPVKSSHERRKGGTLNGVVHDWKVASELLPSSHPAMEGVTFHNARKRVTTDGFVGDNSQYRDEPCGIESEPMLSGSNGFVSGVSGVEEGELSKYERKGGRSSSRSFRGCVPSLTSSMRDRLISVSLLFVFGWSLLGNFCFNTKDTILRGYSSYREFGSFYPLALTSFPKCNLRESLPSYPVGVNLIDIADDTDGDDGNDGLRGYGSSKAREALQHLSGLGVNMVVLPVEVRGISGNDTEVRHGLLGDSMGRFRFAKMIDDAHEAGLAVAVVPHLFFDDGSWRGDINPSIRGMPRKDALNAWFDSYRTVVQDIAKISAERCVEVFSIAAELMSLTTDEDTLHLWSDTIASIREVFPGKLTYSSNWDETTRISNELWKQFDFVGINAFHPITKVHDASFEELKEGELRVQRDLKELKESSGKDIWFMELGFRAMHDSAIHPWLWPGEILDEASRQRSIEDRWDPPISEEEMVPEVDEEYQELAYRAALEAIDESGVLSAVSLWAVPTDVHDDTHGNPRSMWLFGRRYRQDHPQFEPRYGFSFVHKASEPVVERFARTRPVVDE